MLKPSTPTVETRRGIARGGLRGLEHPPLSSAIVGGAIQHNIYIYIYIYALSS